MPVALEEFVKQLTDSGVLAPGKLAEFIPPNAAPQSAQELATALVKQKHLTKYQAQQIYEGHARSLILGNYTILDKIGAGGMGQVFKAEHRRMHRTVAIKMLPSSTTFDSGAIARFQREVEVAARLSHPNIVSAHDADEANGVHFLVMEYVEGNDLFALVKKNGPLPVEQAVNYILQAATGLEFAHAEGVIHRDIKPANLLLDKKGVVKILDMGLARINAQPDTATQAELTGAGAVLGTIDYMAPEQAVDAKHTDARADIYSLGCSFYYLLTGQSVYGGDSLMGKLIAHRETPIPSLQNGPAKVPKAVETVFRKMVAKDAKKRYQSMTEVIGALKQSLPAAATKIVKPPAAETTAGKKGEISGWLGSSPRAPITSASGKGFSRNFKLAIVAGGLLAAIVLAAILIKLPTKNGTLIVEIDQPDATIEVLNEAGTVEITRPGETGKISITIVPGQHRLKVSKDGFDIYGEQFEVAAGGRKSIAAKLVPLAATSGDQPAAGTVGSTEKPWNTPAFQAWTKEVAAMPAEDQVKAVAKKLQELNPGFDGKVTGYDARNSPKIENGVVTEFGFSSDNITDISPVRALVGLKVLNCSGRRDIGKLSDLSPLKGMKLVTLDCGRTNASDLSHLQGMPLEKLLFYHTRVSVLSPLKGMAITYLDFNNAKQVSDIAPLEGMPLATLNCADTLVSDLSPLKGMKLKELQIWSTEVSELSPLREIPLTKLSLHNTEVSDLSPLHGTPLTELDCSGTRIANLSPLRDMNLKVLIIDGTVVSDLSPLIGMPLGELGIWNSGVTDLTPLQGMSLTQIHLTPKSITKGMDVIRQMGSLKGIWLGIYEKDRILPEEFWKRYDAGEFNSDKANSTVASSRTNPITDFHSPAFQQWMKEVAALPAEDQVKAVAKKLQELNPGFDGKVTGYDARNSPKIENGVVTEFGFSSDNITDISPVRAFAGLKQFNCGGRNERWGKLSDLSPLRGMPLTALRISFTDTRSLSPLQGMKLELLDAQFSPVSDLISLQGMPLQRLYVCGTKVTDLSPIQGMPLSILYVQETQVADLRPLQGTPLRLLMFHNTKVCDLSPLQGMPLRELKLTFKPERDTDLLRSIKTLETINDKPAAEFWKEVDAKRQKPEPATSSPADK